MNTSTEPETTSPPPRESTGPAQIESQPRTQTDLFEQLEAYPFSSDREFAAGLAIIFGHSETPASEEEINRDDDLVLQAKCYYFTRKENLVQPLNVADYKSWLETRHAPTSSVNDPRESGSQAAFSNHATDNTNQVSAATSQEPSYPMSFAHIVELITTGQPVPGIQHIPDTLLTGQGTTSAKPKRLKPWEKEESA